MPDKSQMISTSDAAASIADYIDLMYDLYERGGGGSFEFDESDLLRVLNRKAVDAVPVIRCKECKYWNKHDGTSKDFDGHEWHECKELLPYTSASGETPITPSWHYCSLGEKFN